jgi:ABC-type uncharacterized transport system substrate-binding protein
MIRYFLLFTLFINTLLAHPHTFVDVFPSINSKNNKIQTIHFEWSFDEMTSQLLVMEFDQNMDGKIDKAELDFIYTNYFTPLGDYNYYTDIKIKNKALKTAPKNFNVEIKENQKIVYKFDIDINADKKDVNIEFYDQEMFTAFMLKKDFIKSELSYDVVDVDNDFYFAYRLEFN